MYTGAYIPYSAKFSRHLHFVDWPLKAFRKLGVSISSNLTKCLGLHDHISFMCTNRPKANPTTLTYCIGLMSAETISPIYLTVLPAKPVGRVGDEGTVIMWYTYIQPSSHASYEGQRKCHTHVLRDETTSNNKRNTRTELYIQDRTNLQVPIFVAKITISLDIYIQTTQHFLCIIIW